jgi:site-specific DNA recombinase
VSMPSPWSVGEIRDCVGFVHGGEVGGRPHGKLPHGFARQYEVVGGKRRLVEQVTDEQQAAVIREAARQVLDDEAPYAIARDFNARGIPTPPRRFGGSDPGETNRHLANRAASSIATQRDPR